MSNPTYAIGHTWWESKFPESLFPCAKEHLCEYRMRCIVGRQIASTSSVLMLSTARNTVLRHFETVSRVEVLGEMFKNYFVFVYENDSIDDTKVLLRDWSAKNSKVGVLTENIGTESFGSVKSALRTKQLADARNKYVRFAKEYIAKNHVDYIIVFDFDLPGGWSYDGIMNSLGWSYMWDAVGSNGILYRKLEPTEDRPQAMIERLFFDTWAYRQYGDPSETDPVSTNLLLYNRGEPLIRVNSCFGGLAIYQADVFHKDIAYLEGDCDHATLHNKLSNENGRVYLNPSQIVLYSSNENSNVVC